ncbi:hypothetical protein MRX96_031914 [Rhipicephalus microplus]
MRAASPKNSSRASKARMRLERGGLGEPEVVEAHVWKSQTTVGVEEPPALFRVAGAVKQDVLGGLLCRALGTRRAPAAGAQISATA